MQIHDMADRQFWPEYILSPECKKNFWLGLQTSNIGNTGTVNHFMQIVAGTVQFYVWECKIKKTKARLGKL
jgi:G:T-mismatch repair DNA endonuclease (very short patch repair protein)